MNLSSWYTFARGGADCSAEFPEFRWCRGPSVTMTRYHKYDLAMLRGLVCASVMIVAVLMPQSSLSARSSHRLQQPRTPLTARSVDADAVSTPRIQPLRLPDSALEPIEWDKLNGWAADDHAAAFATFLGSCRPLLRTAPSKGETRPMYVALQHVCREAVLAGRLTEEQAGRFFETNFRPLSMTKLGDSAGLLTGYYEPIVDGSRVPTGIFRVPIYRRPPDLVPPLNGTGPGFPNRGQALRRTPSGKLVPYYDRGEILDGALDGQHLEICWIREDGTMLRINYDGHNGYPFVPIGRILIERNIIPRQEMSLERIREWMRANPQSVEEILRQDRSFVFFRIAGLSDEREVVAREAVGAQGVPLTPGRSIAVDNSLHVYGTPIFIQAGLPLSSEKRTISFDRLMIAQDTGSAIVGPARADIYWGAGDQAGHLAGRIRHPGNFAMLVPRELDPVIAGVYMPLPPEKPPPAAVAARTRLPTSPTGQSHRVHLRRSLRNCTACKRSSKLVETSTSETPHRLLTLIGRASGHIGGELRHHHASHLRPGTGF
jgi:membrane-bound lytic murein transglycosylase A